MTRAVILVAQNFQDQEFDYPYYRMLEEGWTVDVASPDGVEVFGKYGVPAKVNKSTIDLSPADYDVVVIPGGFESPDRLRMRIEVLQFVATMYASGKVVAAICHGPWVLISAGVIKGATATCYPSLKDDLINAGGYYIDTLPVVTHLNLVTSDHYRNNGPFMKAVVNRIYSKAHDDMLEKYGAKNA
jgi:protease I